MRQPGRSTRPGRGFDSVIAKRSVFDLCTERARQTDWAAFVPAKQGRVVRFEIVDEEEWRERLHGLLGG